MLNKKNIILVLIGLLFFIIGSIAFYINNDKKDIKAILVITNYSESEKYYKYVKLAEKNINKNNKSLVKIIWFNIDFDKIEKNKRYSDFVKKNIKFILKHNQIIGSIIGSTSKCAKFVLDMFPKNMPIITDASSPYALSKFNGKKIFSISSVPYLSRGKYIFMLAKLLNKKEIIFILGDKSPYSKSIYVSLKNSNELKENNIKLFKYNSIQQLKEHNKNALYVVGIDSSEKSIEYIKSNLNRRNISIFVIYQTNFTKYRDIESNIFASYYSGGIYPDFLEYKCLKNTHIKNYWFLKRYFSVYRIYKGRIDLILETISKNKDLLNKNIDIIRNNIINSLTTFTDKIFVQKCVNYLYTFKEYNLSTFNINKKFPKIYYSNIFDKTVGIKMQKIVNITKNGKVFYPIQYIYTTKNHKPKKVPSLYVNGKIENISILDLSTETALINMYFTISYISKIDGKKVSDFSYPKDIKIVSKSNFVHKQEYSLVKVYHMKDYIYNRDFIYKVYKIKIFIPVQNNLFSFPFDSFYAKLEFAKDNFQLNPYFLQLKNFKINNMDNDIKIIDEIPTYYEDVIFLKPNYPLVVRKNTLLIEMSRKNRFSVIIKYLLPALIVMLIGLYVGYLIIKYNIENDSKGILIDAILGVISIYFVFSLLISIKELIVIDLIFYFMIFSLSVLLIYIFYRFKKEIISNNS